MILDSYIVKACSFITSEQIFNSLIKLYPDIIELNDKDLHIKSIDKFLKKLINKPGLALSTGARNSWRGIYTCALLDVLEVDKPKSARIRSQLAWDILNSQKSLEINKDAHELNEARIERQLMKNRLE